MADYQSMLRDLPAVDRLLKDDLLVEAMQKHPRRLVLQAVQETINKYRRLISENSSDSALLEKLELDHASMAIEAARLAGRKGIASLQPLINATGVVIHTNLGRSPLPQAAVEAMTAVAAGYSNLELNLESGKRGSRQEHLETLLCEICGAEAAVVLNNNAAAVFLALNALAAGREVVISRGQLVEIGGSFRIPEIMGASGAKMVEVGTTNKTYLRDYEAAVTENCVAFLKVHTSNYHLVGFTAAVETGELAALAHKHNLIMIEDLGSGVLLDLAKYNLPAEPKVQDSIAAGADLVTFSGDKMLGGPQAGIIVGRRDLINYIRTSQLARSLRVDKFTIAALEATLRLYLDEERVVKQIPVWHMLTADPLYLKERAAGLASRLASLFGQSNVEVIPGFSKVGGGALPTADLPTHLVKVTIRLEGWSPESLSDQLRRGTPPLILRLQQDSLLLDPRTIFEEQEELLIDRFTECLES